MTSHDPIHPTSSLLSRLGHYSVLEVAFAWFSLIPLNVVLDAIKLIGLDPSVTLSIKLLLFTAINAHLAYLYQLSYLFIRNSAFY